MEVSAPSNACECPYPLEMCYQVSMNKTLLWKNWSETEMFFVFNLVDKPDIDCYLTDTRVKINQFFRRICFKSWRSRLIKPKLNEDLNIANMHFCSKFGNPYLNGWRVNAWTSSKWLNFDFDCQGRHPQNNRNFNAWWVTAWRSSWLIHRYTHGHTDAGNGNTWWPTLALGKNVLQYCLFEITTSPRG